MCTAQWDPVLQLARVTNARGQTLRTVGHSRRGEQGRVAQYLYPEEALWLLQRDKLQLVRAGESFLAKGKRLDLCRKR